MAFLDLPTSRSGKVARLNPPDVDHDDPGEGLTNDHLESVKRRIKRRVSGLDGSDIENIASQQFLEASQVATKHGVSVAVLLSNPKHFRGRWATDSKTHAKRFVPNPFDASIAADPAIGDDETIELFHFPDRVTHFEDDVVSQLDTAAFLASISETDRRITELRADGLGLVEIGDAVGLSKSSVQRRLMNTGLALCAHLSVSNAA